MSASPEYSSTRIPSSISAGRSEAVSLTPSPWSKLFCQLSPPLPVTGRLRSTHKFWLIFMLQDSKLISAGAPSSVCQLPFVQSTCLRQLTLLHLGLVEVGLHPAHLPVAQLRCKLDPVFIVSHGPAYRSILVLALVALPTHVVHVQALLVSFKPTVPYWIAYELLEAVEQAPAVECGRDAGESGAGPVPISYSPQRWAWASLLLAARDQALAPRLFPAEGYTLASVGSIHGVWTITSPAKMSAGVPRNLCDGSDSLLCDGAELLVCVGETISTGSAGALRLSRDCTQLTRS